MILRLVKEKWLLLISYFKPVSVRKNVMVNGEDSEGVVCRKRTPFDDDTFVKYKAYDVEYLLVNIERREGSENVVYRFHDQATKKDFILTKPLVDILFYKKPTT